MDNYCVICKKGLVTIGQPVENGWLCQVCSAEFQAWKLTSAFKAFKAEKAGNLLTLNLIRDHEYKGGMMCNASLCEVCGEEMGRHIIFGRSLSRGTSQALHSASGSKPVDADSANNLHSERL